MTVGWISKETQTVELIPLIEYTHFQATRSCTYIRRMKDDLPPLLVGDIFSSGSQLIGPCTGRSVSARMSQMSVPMVAKLFAKSCNHVIKQNESVIGVNLQLQEIENKNEIIIRYYDHNTQSSQPANINMIFTIVH